MAMAHLAVGLAACLVLLPVAVHGALRNGVYAVQNVNGGKYLNVAGGNSTPGTKVIMWDNPTSKDSQWLLTQLPGTNGSYTLQNSATKLYLTANGTTKGTKLFGWPTASGPGSLWKVVKVANAPGAAYMVKGVASGLYLNVAGGSKAMGALVQLWDNPGSLHSQWDFQGDNCHDARPYEPCYNDTIWAKDYAINTRPQWYPNLTNASSFVDFQAHLYNCYWKRCPRPCTISTQFGCAMVNRFWSNATCEDAKVGTKCYNDTKWAQTYGINIYPQWYPELNANSTFAQFQARLFTGQSSGVEQDHGCKEPCCHDTLPGELCHEDTTWALLYGINLPEFKDVYGPNLTNQSAFVDFQAYLYRCYPRRCPKPCGSSPLMSPSITPNCPDTANLV